jgi:regulator of cell morphogenesis and NO signaling
MDHRLSTHGLMKNLTLTEIATLYPTAIVVLNDNNLDFCCNGHLTFVEACKKQNIDAGALFYQIKNADTTRVQNTSFEGWDLPLLSFLILEQSEYLRHAIGQLLESLYDMENQTSGKTLLVIETIYDKFKSLADQLTDHTYEEGEILRLILDSRLSTKKKAANVIDQNKLADRQIEHYNLIQQLRSIRKLAKEHASMNPSFQMTYIQLEHFNTILTDRIHLENSLLYPQLSA